MSEKIVRLLKTHLIFKKNGLSCEQLGSATTSGGIQPPVTSLPELTIPSSGPLDST